MIGFEYCCKIYEINYKEIADLLGIHKQNISSWVSGDRTIPKKYVEILARKFNINKDYLIQDVDEIRKLEIQKRKIENEAEDGEEFVDPDGVKWNGGKKITIEIMKKLNELDMQIQKERAKHKLNIIIDGLEKNDEIIIEICDIFSSLLNSEKVDNDIVLKVIAGIAFYYKLEEGFTNSKLIENTILMLREYEENNILQVIDGEEVYDFTDNYSEQLKSPRIRKTEMIIKALRMIDVKFKDIVEDDDAEENEVEI